MTERDLQRAIVDALRKSGVWVVRTGVSMKRGKRGTQSGEPGMPDLHLVGLRAWLEVKLPGEELSEEQVEWHEKAKLNGVPVDVATTVAEALLLASTWQLERAIERKAKLRAVAP